MQPRTAVSAEKERNAITRTIESLTDAWNRHDPRAFAMAFTEAADFTNVAGMNAHGRAGIEQFHAPSFMTVFKDSNLTGQIRSIRLLAPDLAAVDVDWQMTGAKMPDGSPRGNRKGLINCVMTRQLKGSWLFEVLHNTELAEPSYKVPLIP